jgi:hypothetical protein
VSKLDDIYFDHLGETVDVFKEQIKALMLETALSTGLPPHWYKAIREKVKAL